MCLHAVGPGHRADEPGLQEGAPLVDQTAVTSVVVLFFGKGGGGHKNTVSPSVASSLALTPPPPDLKIKKKPRWSHPHIRVSDLQRQEAKGGC